MKKIILGLMLLGTVGYTANRITNADIASNAAIAFSKLESLTSGNIIVGNVSNVPTSVSLSGDATLSNAGVLSIAANAITDGKLRQSAGLSVIGRSANSTGNVADITAGSDFNILRRSGTAIGFGSIDLSQSGAVGSSVLGVANGGTGQSTFTDGQLLIGNSTGNTLTKATLTAGSGISITNGAGSISIAYAGSTDAVTKSISQTGHGLSVGDVVRYNGTNYVDAQADSDANAEVIGIVSAVADVNNFTLLTSGFVSGLSGLTAGETYFLSASTAGAITATEPTAYGQVSKPVLLAVSTTSGYFIQSRGYVVGGNGGSLARYPSITFTGSAGFGTNTIEDSAYCMGGNLFVKAVISAGSPAASAASITLPTGYEIDFTKLPSGSSVVQVGDYTGLSSTTYTMNTLGVTGKIYTNGSTNNALYMSYQWGSSAFTTANGSDIVVGSGGKVALTFDYPTSGCN